MKRTIPRRLSSALQTLDRRAIERIPKNETALLWLSAREFLVVRIVDESDGGTGLNVPAYDFQIGNQVRLERDFIEHTARIVYVRELDDEYYRVGLAWV